jgi:hypothetical protein
MACFAAENAEIAIGVVRSVMATPTTYSVENKSSRRSCHARRYATGIGTDDGCIKRRVNSAPRNAIAPNTRPAARIVV